MLFFVLVRLGASCEGNHLLMLDHDRRVMRVVIKLNVFSLVIKLRYSMASPRRQHTVVEGHNEGVLHAACGRVSAPRV